MLLFINMFMLSHKLIYLLFNLLRTQLIASLDVAASIMQKMNTKKVANMQNVVQVQKHRPEEKVQQYL